MKKQDTLITKESAELILLWCQLKYGPSIWSVSGKISIKVRSNINYYGKYETDEDDVDSSKNYSSIFVNLKKHKKIIELVDTIIHEYTHHKQPILKKFDEYLNSGYNTDNHPFELEAQFIAKRDSKECKKWLLKKYARQFRRK